MRRPRAPRDVVRACVLASLASAPIAARTDAQADVPPCLADATLSASRVVVGQAVEHRVRILRRTDVAQTRWTAAPDFAGLRIETLPGGFVAGRFEREGRWVLVYEERRLLFPLHPGRLSVGAARIECLLHERSEHALPSSHATLGALPLEVVAVPDAPPGWSGLVGEVAVSVHTDRSDVPLGGSLRIVASVVGNANVQAIPTPLVSASDDAELLAGDDVQEIEAGDPLRLRRTAIYDLVPRRAGRLTVQGVPILYFDPVAQRFARTPAVDVHVQVRDAAPARNPHGASGDVARSFEAGPDDNAHAAALQQGERRDDTAIRAGDLSTVTRAGDASETSRVGGAAVVAAAVSVAILLVWRWRRRAERAHRARFRATADPDRSAQRPAVPAITSASRDDAAQFVPRAPSRDTADDTARLVSALRSLLARRVAPGAATASWTTEELASRAPAGSAEAAAAALLVAHDRARFARDARPFDPVALREALRALGGEP